VAVRTRLVGREAELQAIDGFLSSVSAAPGILVLDGPAGIGKTALLGAALDLAHRHGMVVLAARPTSSDARLTLSSLADLVSPVPARVLASLPPTQRTAIDVALLRSADPGASTDPRALGAAFLSVLERLGEESAVLLALDDAQWVDVSSRSAISYAMRRVGGGAGLIATVRDDPDLGLGLGLEEWLLSGDADSDRRVTVGPLLSAPLQDLLRDRLGITYARPTMSRIEESSGGNPLHALELARYLAAAGPGEPPASFPPNLRRLVDARIGTFSPAVRETLLVVAAMSNPTVDVVEQAVAEGGGPARAVDHLLLAEEAGLVTLDGRMIAFTHPLLRTGVYAMATPGQRRTTHRRLARVVVDTEERARHRALGSVGLDLDVLQDLDGAAELARRRGAPASAAELLNLAVRLGGATPERRLRLARHLFDAGDPQQARRVAEEVVAALAPGEARAAALHLLAIIRLHDDSYVEAAALLDRALAEPEVEPRLRVRISVDQLFVLVNLGRIPDALALTAPTVADAEGAQEASLLAEAQAGAVMVRFLAGLGVDDALLARALELEDPESSSAVMVRPSLISALLSAWTGRLDEARDRLVALRRQAIERGAESDLMFMAFHHVLVECWRGSSTEARLLAEDTAERARQLGTDIPHAIALCSEAAVAAYAGEPERCRAAATQALAIFERGGSLAVRVWPLVTLGFVEVSVGDHTAALRALGPLIAAAPAMGYGEPTAAPFAPDAAEALIAVGRYDEAETLVTQLLAHGRRLDRAWALALGSRCEALLLAARGDLPAALDATARALAQHERLPLPLELGRTLLVRGRLLRRHHQRRAAAECLQRALSIFESLGTPLWSEHARSELARVQAPASTGDVLTASERRVAELAGSGQTNREVARALFISPKTVEVHLANVYRKLGIRSRAELGRRMAGPGS
jgi:DNA-binding CsgD family transcriptional regulator